MLDDTPPQTHITQACVKVCVRELGKRDPTFADALKRKTYAKLGRDHADLRAVRPCPVPLVVVGNKYDIFKVRTATCGRSARSPDTTDKRVWC